MTHVVSREVGGRTLSIETGLIAKQAAGATIVRWGDCAVFCAVTWGEPRFAGDFFPLTVDYRENNYAAGKIPGGFFKREGRPTTKEILTARLIDRPVILYTIENSGLATVSKWGLLLICWHTLTTGCIFSLASKAIHVIREYETIESAVPFPAPEKGDNWGLSPFHPRIIIVIGECPLLSPV